MIKQTDLWSYEKEPIDFGIKDFMIRQKMRLPGGTVCPCCSQHIQLYKRTITGAMAKALILIYRYYQSHSFETSIQVEGYLKRCRVGSTIRGDFPKLRYWGLIRKSEEKRTRAGHYFLTADGMGFVKGNVSVKKYCLVFNNQTYGFEGGLIKIKDCLGKKFDYDALMRGEQ